MGSLGVFRDEFYNAGSVLTSSQITTTAQASGVLVASQLVNAQENYITSSVATAFTTDSAVNIIANLQQAVAAAQKANVGGFSSALGSNPPLGVPNLFNASFYVQIGNTAAALTISAGTGVTLVGSAVVPTAGMRMWVVTITGPASVTFTTIGAVSLAGGFIA